MSPRAEVIRVTTFNVRYAEADDGPNNWERRKGLALRCIRTCDPDLLGLQECSTGPQAAYFRRHLREWTFSGVPTGDPDWPTEMAPVLVNRRTFALIGAGHFWLSETPDIPSKSWGAAFARTLTWVEVRHRRTGVSLVFANTHLDYEREANRRSAEALDAWIRATVRRLPVILTGDFNASKRSAAYRRLGGSRVLRDVFRDAGTVPGGTGSFHAYGALSPPQSLDWILVSRHFTVVSARVDRCRHRDLFPSDHDPVTAVLSIASR